MISNVELHTSQSGLGNVVRASSPLSEDDEIRIVLSQSESKLNKPFAIPDGPMFSDSSLPADSSRLLPNSASQALSEGEFAPANRAEQSEVFS